MSIRNNIVEARRSSLRVPLSVFLVFGALSAMSAKAGVLIDEFPYETSREWPNSTAMSDCGGEYWVGTTAKLISIPRTKDNDPVHCKWLLKARDFRQTIALSATDTSLDYLAEKFRFRLEARDGWNSDSPLIGVLETSPERVIVRADFKLITPMKATSGFMLIQFWNEGHDPLQIDLAYYACGGKTDSSASISSPVFNETPLPSVIECEWRLEKPEMFLYGYLRPLFLNVSDCCSVSLRSNSTMRVLENVRQNSKKNTTISNEIFANSSLAENSTSLSGEGDLSCITTPSELYMVPICGDSIRLIAFESDFAILRYSTLKPSRAVGFRAVYGVFPRRKQNAPNDPIWYLDYSALTIFTPIGTIIGAIIIIYQTRKRVPKKSSVVVEITGPSVTNLRAALGRTASLDLERGAMRELRTSPGKRANLFGSVRMLSKNSRLKRSGSLNNEASARKSLVKISRKKRPLIKEESSLNTTNTEVIVRLQEESSLRESRVG